MATKSSLQTQSDSWLIYVDLSKYPARCLTGSTSTSGSGSASGGTLERGAERSTSTSASAWIL